MISSGFFRNLFKPKKQNNSKHSFQNVAIQSGSIVSPDCIIGAFTYIGFNCTITKCIIGKYCSIANNVSIGAGEHPLDRVSTSSLFYENPYEMLTEKDCKIGNDVWIGTNSVVRRGIEVGDGVVIGANSFVNKNIPDFAICAGAPARIIRYRYNPKQIELIKASGWWNHDPDHAKTAILKVEKELSRECG
jgi:acetyltransferase-like isoleucine patch superfamily enzyme